MNSSGDKRTALVLRRSKRHQKQNQQHPLLNNEVLSCVFSYLSLEDLKNCRFVCTKWSFVVEPFLRQVSRIAFKDLSRRHGLRNPTNFNKVFKNAQTSIPFTAFKFGFKHREKPLRTFMEQHKNIMTELTLTDIILKDENGNKYDRYDMSPMIGNQLTKLKVTHCPFWEFGVLYFSTDKFQFLNELNLNSCTVNIVPKSIRMKAKKVKLHLLKFVNNDTNEITSPLVNEFLDLSQVKELQLQMVTLDMNVCQGEVADSKRVELERVHIENYEQAAWTIDKLKLDFIAFPDIINPRVRIRELELFQCTINIAVLPPTIEKLTIHLSNGISCSSTLHLPQLKSLKLKDCRTITCLTHFTDCPKLSELILTMNVVFLEWLGTQLLVRFSWFPNSLKVLAMGGNFKVVADKSFKLDALYMEGFHLKVPYLKRVFSKLTPKRAYINSLCIWNEGRNHAQLMKLILSPYIETFVVGPFTWAKSWPLVKSSLSAYVNKQSDYYSFKKGKGKGISDDQFKDLTKEYLNHPIPL